MYMHLVVHWLYYTVKCDTSSFIYNIVHVYGEKISERATKMLSIFLFHVMSYMLLHAHVHVQS